jgi:hypothetical protein
MSPVEAALHTGPRRRVPGLCREEVAGRPPGGAGAGQTPLHIDVHPTDRGQGTELERLLGFEARKADIGQTG